MTAPALYGIQIVLINRLQPKNFQITIATATAKKLLLQPPALRRCFPNARISFANKVSVRPLNGACHTEAKRLCVRLVGVTRTRHAANATCNCNCHREAYEYNSLFEIASLAAQRGELHSLHYTPCHSSAPKCNSSGNMTVRPENTCHKHRKQKIQMLGG